MKKVLSFIFLIVVLLFATIGSEFIKPYTAYFSKILVDKNDPFNFKNEYELLIFQNEQSVSKEVFSKTLDSISLDVGDKDVFIECVIDKNIEELTNLSKSKFNPINPKTFDDLDRELKKYQPTLIEVQTESIKKCTPKKEISEPQESIELSCKCENVIVHPQSVYAKEGNIFCGSPVIREVKSVLINLEDKTLRYDDKTFPLVVDNNTYVGIDLDALDRCNDGSSCNRLGKAPMSTDEFNFVQSMTSPAVEIERLTGNLDYRQYYGFETESGFLSGKGYRDKNNQLSYLKFTPAFTEQRQCSLTSKL